jgi:hypothetical protein
MVRSLALPTAGYAKRLRFSRFEFFAWGRLILTAGRDFAAEPGAGARTRLTLFRGEGVPTGPVYAQTMKSPSLRIR